MKWDVCYLLILSMVLLLPAGAAVLSMKGAIRRFAGAVSRPRVVVVVGGGAAGYFSAIECARSLQESRVPSKVCHIVLFQS